MKKILLVTSLLVSLMFCVATLGWAGGLDDANAGIAAAKRGNNDEAIRLFTKAIASGELSQENLSIVLYYRGVIWGNKGDYDKAIVDYTKAIEIDPKYAPAYNDRGYAWYAKGDYDKAIVDYTNAIELDPKFASAYRNRGYAWREKGDYDRAIADFTKAIELYPKYADAYWDRGLAWDYKGDYDKAIADFTKVIELEPKNTLAYHIRGLAWGEKGDYDRAIADFTKAIELHPEIVLFYEDRGYAWRKKGDYDRAIADYTKAIELAPKDPSAYNSLARLMATCLDDRYRDGKKAVELAEKAVQLEENTWNLDALAAAYAEAGRFQDAIKTQERAITKLEQEGRTKALPEYEKHLSSYKAGKPWREK